MGGREEGADLTGKNAYNMRLTIKEREESMATGKALDGKPYAGNPHVRFDEGEVAPAATPRRGSLLYKLDGLKMSAGRAFPPLAPSTVSISTTRTPGLASTNAR